MSQLFNIANPFIFGLGVSNQLPKLIDDYKATSVLLVCSPSINQKPVDTELTTLLKQKRISFIPFRAMFHIPHGIANAVVLPEVLYFNSQYCPEKIS